MRCNRGGGQGILPDRAGAAVRKMLKAGLAVALALAACAGAQAQSRGRPGTPVRVLQPSAARMVRTQQTQLTASQFAGDVIVLSEPSLLSLDVLPIRAFPVPGLGFDFAHLAALNRNFKVSDFSVLSTVQRLALTQPLTPIVPFAVPFFSAPTQVIVVPPPPVVVVQQASVPAEPVEVVARARPVERRESPEASRSPEPLDVSEFVLVRRDGRLVFAVAFSTQGDLLTYVTREGVRRSLPLVELDIETTRRMNEERGTTIHLPA